MTESNLTRIDAAGSPLLVEDYFAGQLLEGEAVHRELRDRLRPDYLAEISKVFASGARLTQLLDGGKVRAVAVWRVFHTTHSGLLMEVDDLVTQESARSRGHGAVLLRFLEAEARRLGCKGVTLNSANHRTRAHQFYLREGYRILASHFAKGVRGDAGPGQTTRSS